MTNQLFKNLLYSTRTRQKWQRLKSILKPDDRIGVIIYGDPDPDSLAAGWGFQHLVKPYVGNVRVIATQSVKRIQNVRFQNALKIPVEYLEKIPWHEFDKLAVLDGQPDFFKPALPVPFDIVIDHHPKKENYSFKFSDVRPDYGSTSTMILEYLILAGTKTPKKLLTALWYGLKTDTDNISKTATPADVAAYGYLFRKSDRNLIKWLEASEIPLAFREYYKKGLEQMRPKDSRQLVVLGKVPSADACVQLADFMSSFIGFRWVSVAGICGDTLYIILRGGSYNVNVGRIAKRRLDAYGSAGGHQGKARAEISIKEVYKAIGKEFTDQQLEAWIRKILLGVRSKNKKV